MIHRAKKSLGQNFLKSLAALSQIIVAGDISAEDTILEIGPGKGALTEKLLQHAGRVIAVEKDRALVEYLREKFEKEIKAGKFELVEGDVLQFNPSGASASSPSQGSNNSYKLIANIPYNITGEILRKFLGGEHQPSKMVLLVQKEVAERIVVRDGKESILSISVKAYGDPKYIAKVPARYFSPAPKVDSAIICINNISKKKLEGVDETFFFKVLKAGFAHKRKLAVRNLESISTNKEFLTSLFEKQGLPLTIRPEEIAFPVWLELAKELLSPRNHADA
jgi:16S rRNA (adenine1518-N6/adenine1519-N6)-dimethyltransferase